MRPLPSFPTLINRSDSCFGMGVTIWLYRVPPPPPRSMGLMELGGNLKIIYGAQRVTGKVLIPKGLVDFRIVKELRSSF